MGEPLAAGAARVPAAVAGARRKGSGALRTAKPTAAAARTLRWARLALAGTHLAHGTARLGAVGQLPAGRVDCLADNCWAGNSLGRAVARSRRIASLGERHRNQEGSSLGVRCLEDSYLEGNFLGEGSLVGTLPAGDSFPEQRSLGDNYLEGSFPGKDFLAGSLLGLGEADRTPVGSLRLPLLL